MVTALLKSGSEELTVRSLALPTPQTTAFQSRCCTSETGGVTGSALLRRRTPRPTGPSGLASTIALITGRTAAHEFFADVARDYPRIARFRAASESVYVLSDPSIINEVMIDQAHSLMKGRALQQAKRIVGEGLLTSEGDFHMRQRRLVQPAFHRDRLARYATDMVAVTKEHESTWTDGRHLDLSSDMSTLTLSIVGRTLFGSDLTGDAEEVGTALTTIIEDMQSNLLFSQDLLLRLPLKRNRRIQESINDLDAVVARQNRAHRNGEDQGDLLSKLVASEDDGTAMDDTQVRDEVMTLLLAGHETTAMALTWTWYLLDQSPAAAESMRAELARVVGDRGPTIDDVADLPYTRGVVHESLRLYPPAWIIGRRALADVHAGGWTIPAGSLIVASQWVMNRHPDYWESPEEFRPQRWLDEHRNFDERAPGQERGAWFPFGWGRRRCVGENFALTEAVLVLASLAQRWAPRPMPGRVVVPEPLVTLRPRGGLPATLVER